MFRFHFLLWRRLVQRLLTSAFILLPSSFCLQLPAADMAASAASSSPTGAETEGHELVQRLLEQRPAENSSLKAVLKDPQGKRPDVLLEIRTTVTRTNWQNLYMPRGANQSDLASLLIVHADDRPNEYFLARFMRPANDTNGVVRLTGNQTMTPFADSDFWVADLGLEFLQWPAQAVVKKVIRSGLACSVLQSVNPSPTTNGYARVLSWIDSKSGGIIHAEAYDASGKLIKEFDPKNLQKINGQWQVREMQIRNNLNGSRTRLEFDLGGK